MLQSCGLIPLLTAAENVELALAPTGLPRREIRAQAAVELDRLGVLALIPLRQGSAGSGGTS